MTRGFLSIFRSEIRFKSAYVVEVKLDYAIDGKLFIGDGYAVDGSVDDKILVIAVQSFEVVQNFTVDIPPFIPKPIG